MFSDEEDWDEETAPVGKDDLTETHTSGEDGI